MKILVSFRGIPQSPGWATGDMVVKAFRELGNEVFPYAKYYQQNKWVENRSFNLDDHDFDLILFMECNDGDSQYTELKITRARKTACWLFDTSYHVDRYKQLVDYFCFNHIFLANPITIQEYKVWGYDNVTYLPYACDRDLHERSLEYTKTRDVVLVGSIRDDRRALVLELSRLGINLELIGNVFREDYINTLASAKIVINQNPNAGRGLLNMRYWETPAAGSLILTEAADYSEQPLNLCSGYQYNDTEEIAKLCHRALDNPGPVADYLAMIQKYNFKHHTYQNRCQQILNTIYPT